MSGATYIDGSRALPARFQLGDEVRVRARNGVVTGLLFRAGLLWYEINGALYRSHEVNERLVDLSRNAG